MNNLSFFCMAMIHVYESCLNKYKSWSESFIKPEFKDQLRLWLHFLITLAHLDVSDPRGYWQKEFEKMEPSEVNFLTEIRCKPFISILSLEQEILVYKTLKNLYCI